jgi:hypothetical protein
MPVLEKNWLFSRQKAITKTGLAGKIQVAEGSSKNT